MEKQYKMTSIATKWWIDLIMITQSNLKPHYDVWMWPCLFAHCWIKVKTIKSTIERSGGVCMSVAISYYPS